MTTHPCGCVTATDPASGVTRSSGKCPFHVEALAKQPRGEAYYAAIGVFDENGAIRSADYVSELESVLGPLPPPPRQFAGRRVAEALEVGCGVSPYVAAIEAAGYKYLGMEPDRWAAEKTMRVYGVEVWCDKYTPQSFGPESFDLILAAHCVEHMEDGPAALKGMADQLVPGGHLVVIVPDDTDRVNPDHTWFFSAESLYATLTHAGLLLAKIGERKGNERENFIYALAKKPEWTRGW